MNVISYELYSLNSQMSKQLISKKKAEIPFWALGFNDKIQYII